MAYRNDRPTYRRGSGGRPLEGINCWIARAAGMEFRGVNESSARNRAEAYLRNNDIDAPVTVEAPK